MKNFDINELNGLDYKSGKKLLFILELIEDENLELNCSIDKLKKVPVKIDRHKQAFENWSEGEPVKVWFDSDNNLCIEYESGNWWHYNENCEWW